MARLFGSSFLDLFVGRFDFFLHRGLNNARDYRVFDFSFKFFNLSSVSICNNEVLHHKMAWKNLSAL